MNRRMIAARQYAFWGWLAAALLVLATAGCGPEPNEGRVPLQGNIIRAGQVDPASGLLTLLPQEGGPTVSVTVDQGHFAFSRENGPRPGRHRVIWVAYPASSLQPQSPAAQAEAKLESHLTDNTAAEQGQLQILVPDRPPYERNLELPP